MSSELLRSLEAHEAEVVAILTPLYDEVRHWERELGNTRKAKRAAASVIEARRVETSKTGSIGDESAAPQEDAHDQ